jgi:hypothetical protein
MENGADEPPLPVKGRFVDSVFSDGYEPQKTKSLEGNEEPRVGFDRI